MALLDAEAGLDLPIYYNVTYHTSALTIPVKN